MRWAERVACVEYMRDAYNISSEKPECKTRQPWRRGRIWEDNVKMAGKEMVLVVDLAGLG
jgi:hypothetical protein